MHPTRTRPAARALAMACGFAAALVLPDRVHAADGDVADLKREIGQIRAEYEARLKALEARLSAAEAAAAQPRAPAAVAAPPTAAAPAPTAGAIPPAGGRGLAAGSSAFNPALSLILSGTYASLQRDPATWRLAGFQTGGEIGPGTRSFGLGESELGIAANIDPLFYGAANISITPDDTAAVEEAFVQTTALPGGLTLKFGRFFSGIGYLNEQHAHVWDFVDAPLPYQAFLGGQRNEDGAQLRWLLPTDTFVELGAELGGGRSFPGSDGNRNGAGAWSLFAHTGGDVGLSNSWRAGLSYLQARPRERESADVGIAGNDVVNAFSGRSKVWVLDGVWKWAPNGNATRTNFKLQGEYFRSRENGTLTYDTASTASAGDYRSSQSGWYVQGIWQFMPRWRTGLRYDRVDVGTVDYGLNAASLAAPAFNPTRLSWMVDWSPSEFSRLRLQLARDRTREGVDDNQLYLQYQMSLGAHGAHSY